MSTPLQPLLDAEIAADKIVASVIVDETGRTLGWDVRAVADVDGITVTLRGVAVSLPAAVSTCLEQLYAAKGVNLVLARAGQPIKDMH